MAEELKVSWETIETPAPVSNFISRWILFSSTGTLMPLFSAFILKTEREMDLEGGRIVKLLALQPLRSPQTRRSRRASFKCVPK